MAETLAIDEIRKLLKFISRGYKVPKIVYDTIYKVAKTEVEDKKKVVLVKRDPNIGRGRIQAMYVRITDGDAIEIYPTQVVSYGADFDGDSMNVYVPVSKEAQKQAREKMIVATSNEKIDSQNYAISNEMLLGLYVLSTRDNGGLYSESGIDIKKITSGELEKLKDLDPGKRIKVIFRGKKIETTVGQALLNSIFPTFFDEYWVEPATKKSVNKLLSTIISEDRNEYGRVLDELMRFGFYYATTYPQSVSIDMFEIPESLKKLKKKLSESKSVKEQDEIIKLMEVEMLEYLKKSVPDLYTAVKSGATKDISQLRQIMVSKGLIKDPEGRILPPISSSFTDGYTPPEYFDAAAGARTGIIGRALNTASGGYEYRKIIYVVGNVKANINNPDCETDMGLKIKITRDIFGRMNGRYIIDKDKKVIPLTKDMIGKVIQIRSPIFCKSWRICRTCYGKLLSQVKSENVGMISAQEVASLSERFMKAFHLGGIVSFVNVDIHSELLNASDDALDVPLKKYTEQKSNILYLKEGKCFIKIPAESYKDKFAITDLGDSYNLPTGVFTLVLDERIEILVRIEREIEIYKTQDTFVREIDGNIIVNYDKVGQKILKVKSSSLDYTKVTQRLDDLVSGKTPSDSVSALYDQFYNTLAPTGDWDSIHLEVLISNILRAEVNPQLPARMKVPFKYKMFSIKSLPSIISWPLGMAFENLTSALKYGLTSDRGPESEIEKVLIGVSLSKK